RSLQQLGGNLVAHLNGAEETEATFAIDMDEEAPIAPAEAVAHLAFGARLKSYRFDKYKTKEKPEQKASLRRITVTTAAPSAPRTPPISPATRRRTRSSLPAISFPSRPT